MRAIIAAAGTAGHINPRNSNSKQNKRRRKRLKNNIYTGQQED